MIDPVAASSIASLDSAGSAPAQLSAENLRRSFQLGSRKIEVLRGIRWTSQAGEAVFLCGASGAGKTTLLYTLAGLERPESGTVEFRGHAPLRGERTAQARFAQ